MGIGESDKKIQKDFLERDNISGINPGYKVAAEKFVKLMIDLFPEE